MKHTTCIADGCTKPNFARGLCTTHYSRQRNNGDFRHQPLNAPHDITGKRYGQLVALRKEGKQWLCQCDCGGTRLSPVGMLNAPDGYRHCGNREIHRHRVNAGYRAVHTRLEAAFGKASNYSCVDCGAARAAQWSYDGTDENQVGGNNAYSYSLGHYQPRCLDCHTAYDMQYGLRGVVNGTLKRRPQTTRVELSLCPLADACGMAGISSTGSRIGMRPGYGKSPADS